MSRSRDVVHPWKIKKGGTMIITIPKWVVEELEIDEKNPFLVGVTGNTITFRKIT